MSLYFLSKANAIKRFINRHLFMPQKPSPKKIAIISHDPNPISPHDNFVRDDIKRAAERGVVDTYHRIILKDVLPTTNQGDSDGWHIGFPKYGYDALIEYLGQNNYNIVAIPYSNHDNPYYLYYYSILWELYGIPSVAGTGESNRFFNNTKQGAAENVVLVTANDSNDYGNGIEARVKVRSGSKSGDNTQSAAVGVYTGLWIKAYDKAKSWEGGRLILRSLMENPTKGRVYSQKTGYGVLDEANIGSMPPSYEVPESAPTRANVEEIYVNGGVYVRHDIFVELLADRFHTGAFNIRVKDTSNGKVVMQKRNTTSDLIPLFVPEDKTYSVQIWTGTDPVNNSTFNITR